MLRFLVIALALLGCTRSENKVCPDPVAPEKAAKSAVAPMRTIDIPLPKAAAFGDAESILAVAMDAAGRTMVNGLPITDDKEIFEAAKKALATTPSVKAVVVADPSVTYGRVIAVIDRVRMAGIAKLAFGVPSSPSAPP